MKYARAKSMNIPKMENKIAIIGMAGVFPGANNINEFWNNLILGKETITKFDEVMLSEALSKGHCIKARGILDNIHEFDEKFFKMTSFEAALTDPQHRVFLQSCWEALELAGYVGTKTRNIGVYAGCSDSSYLLNCVLKNKEFNSSNDSYSRHIGNSNHFLATKVSLSLQALTYFLRITTPHPLPLTVPSALASNALHFPSLERIPPLT